MRPHEAGHRILDHLRRGGPATATEMARSFGVSSVAVRSQIVPLLKEGLVRVAAVRPSRGRPSRVYVLTPEGRARFPARDGALAVLVLDEVEREHGREAVVGALRRRSERLREAYASACDGGDGGHRLRTLARLRDEEGYVCRAAAGDAGGGEIVEHHCPVESVARRWPELCRMEEEVFAAVLGRPVRRVEHLLQGGSCCRYVVGAPV